MRRFMITAMLCCVLCSPVVASEIAIREAIEKYYGSQHALELKKVMDEMAEAEAVLLARTGDGWP